MDKSATSRTATSSGSLSNEAVTDISEALCRLLADAFCLYMKTKSFHWHMTGSHFRDYHLLLDEQAGQVFAMTDVVAERGRKIGGNTLRSIGDIMRQQRLRDNDEETLSPQQMLSDLQNDNSLLTVYMRDTHEICAKYGDVATASFIEVWIDETERRTWFLAAVTRSL